MPNPIRSVEQEIVMYRKHLELSKEQYMLCIVDMMPTYLSSHKNPHFLSTS